MYDADGLCRFQFSQHRPCSGGIMGRKGRSFRAKLQPYDAAGLQTVTHYLKRPIKVDRPKGTTKKQLGKRPRDDNGEDDAHPAAKVAKAPALSYEAPKIEARGKTKTDWSTEENQQLFRAAVDDWDNHAGRWELGDSYGPFGAKCGIPKVSCH